MRLTAGIDGEPSWARCDPIYSKNVAFDVVAVVGLVSDVKRKIHRSSVDDVVLL